MNSPFSLWRLPLPSGRRPSLTLAAVVVLPVGLLLVVLLLPLLTLLWRGGAGSMAGAWRAPLVVSAWQLSLLTSSLTTLICVVIGVPVAYILARYQFPGAGLLDILVDLPMVLPPAVAGVALLVTFGRNGTVGGLLAEVGVELPFTTAAVVVAQTFVAIPFFIRAAKAGFAGVDPRLEQISATLGENTWGTFWRVTLPLARNSLLGGAIMAWARSLGEFGATIVFAGNFAGRTQTMPLAIYAAMQSDLSIALTLAAMLLLSSFVLLALLRGVAH